MKNLPSFNDFKKYESLIETVDRELNKEFASLESAEPNHTINEGIFGDYLKNSLSKFFLGSLSRVGMIDKARKLLVDLEIDIIEKRDSFEETIEKLDSEIDGLSSINDKEKINAVIKDRDSKIKELESFLKSHALKIRKAKDYINKVIEGNSRRREYYEAARADDEIALAELEYKLAKDRADDADIKKFEEKIKEKKKEAEEKAQDLKDEMDKESESKKGPESDNADDLSLDPEKEKRKVAGRRGKDIIERKKELEKDIADLRADLERKLTTLEKRIKANPNKVSKSYVERIKVELLELSSALDSKKNLLKLFRDLGKTESDIDKKLSKEQEFTKLANMINQGIVDGEDANSGTKKIISDVFVTPTGNIDASKLKFAKDKLNN
jgi:DNA repair exonuclease SbcCD ATPase subunit